jgi:hypothetical protein
MTTWRSVKAKRVLAGLLRIGWGPAWWRWSGFEAGEEELRGG